MSNRAVAIGAALMTGAILLLAVLVVVLVGGIARAPARGPVPLPTVRPTETATAVPAVAPAVAALEATLTRVYTETAPSVVVIQAVIRPTPGPSATPAAQVDRGAGFVVGPGYVLTNDHVVGDGTAILVTFRDGESYPATIAGRDPADDLAVLAVTAPVTAFVPARLGDSAAVLPGQVAIAVGNPFDLTRSLSVGVVSAVDRTRANGSGHPLRGMIQFDAPINPGNSGGPVLNSRGEVIGIATSIESPVRGSVGVGFAVPMATVRAVLPRLRAGEHVAYPWLGVSGQALTGWLANAVGVTSTTGFYVVDVSPGGPAQRAGVRGASGKAADPLAPARGGDVILAVDGEPVRQAEAIGDLLDARKRPGDRVDLAVLRAGRVLTLTAQLATWPTP